MSDRVWQQRALAAAAGLAPVDVPRSQSSAVLSTRWVRGGACGRGSCRWGGRWARCGLRAQACWAVGPNEERRRWANGTSRRVGAQHGSALRLASEAQPEVVRILVSVDGSAARPRHPPSSSRTLFLRPLSQVALRGSTGAAPRTGPDPPRRACSARPALRTRPIPCDLPRHIHRPQWHMTPRLYIRSDPRHCRLPRCVRCQSPPGIRVERERTRDAYVVITARVRANAFWRAARRSTACDYTMRRR
ncbi:hypothetical protein C8Q77DRAFT_675495 [Trametes polyzona]|nr:hypothetical protein C8Q77DRAFT_675495 [Trametes polyzona]